MPDLNTCPVHAHTNATPEMIARCPECQRAKAARPQPKPALPAPAAQPMSAIQAAAWGVQGFRNLSVGVGQ